MLHLPIFLLIDCLGIQGNFTLCLFNCFPYAHSQLKKTQIAAVTAEESEGKGLNNVCAVRRDL